MNMKAAALSTAALLLVPSALALNGDGRQSFSTYDGWKAFEVVTQGDSLGGHKVPGQMDGIGAYLTNGGANIRVLLNHETPYECDTKSDSSVTELILSKSSFLSAISNMITTGSTRGVQFVNSMGLAYNSYRTKDGTPVSGFGGKPFKWFCSGKVHKANTFGNGKGFVDQMYIFGEEADSSGGWGRFFAIHEKTLHMISGSGSGDATARQGGINGLPPDALENMAMIDTGETNHVALLCSPDYGTRTLKLYVGIKGFRTNGQSCGACTGDADFLARNGLAFGSVFYLQGSLPSNGGSRSGSFGTNRNSAITAQKLEDVATSPQNPTRVVLAEQLSGVYQLNFDIKFNGGTFSASSSSFSITKLNMKASNPDNVEWSADGSIYAVSDDQTGAVTRMTPDGKVKIIAGNRFNGEASGLVDISELLDLAPSSVLLVNAMTCPTSMSVLINPETQLETPKPTNKPSTGPTTKSPTLSPTTLSPTKTCGDGTCALNENRNVCFADCGNKSLQASTITSNGAVGVFFTLYAIRDLEVSSLGFYRNSQRSDFVEIFTRVGSYKGYESSENGWQLVHNAAVTSSGSDGMTDSGTFSTKVTIRAGTVQSFFVYTTDTVLYSVGTVEGSLFSGNDSLQFFEGAGMTGRFSGTSWPPRVFAGEIRYDIISLSTMSPTNKPTTQPTKKPTIQPTREPSTRPTKKPTSQPTDKPTIQPTVKQTLKPTQFPVTKNPSTASPTQKPNLATCGNGSCELEETATMCSQDCESISLTTHNEGTSGAFGVMFFVKARRDVKITSFNFFTNTEQTDLIEVYVRDGMYLGHELDQIGWSLVLNKNVTQLGRDELTKLGGLDTEVTIQAGSIKSFFIYAGVDKYIMYDQGSVTGQMFTSDASLEFFEGTGVTSKFSGTYEANVHTPRVFKGEIIYDAISLTAAPTPIPTKSPTVIPNCPNLDEAQCLAKFTCRWLPVVSRCIGISSKANKNAKRV